MNQRRFLSTFYVDKNPRYVLDNLYLSKYTVIVATSVGKNIVCITIYFRIKTTYFEFRSSCHHIICPSVSYDKLLTQNSQYFFLIIWLSLTDMTTWYNLVLTYLNLFMYLFDIYVLKEKFYEKLSWVINGWWHRNR